MTIKFNKNSNIKFNLDVDSPIIQSGKLELRENLIVNEKDSLELQILREKYD